jgi:hypothetical protein
VFNSTFSNISAISWRSVLVVEEAGSSEIDKLKTAGIVSQTSHLFQYGVFCPLEEEL